MLIDTGHLLLFALVLMRMTGFIVFNPVLGHKSVPGMAKAGMAMVLACMIYPTASALSITLNEPIMYAVLLLKEFVVGYLLGFIMNLYQFVITFVGAIIDFQMGLSMAQVYDPQTGVQAAVSGSLLNVFFMLLFFAVDAHLALFKILIQSSQVVPYGEVAIGPEAFKAIVAIFLECVVLGVKMAMPIIATEFLAEVGAGILMKAVPQINLFVLNIQLKLAIGLIMLLLLSSPIKDYMGTMITDMMNELQGILRFAAA